jgi:hypothetical protein
LKAEYESSFIHKKDLRQVQNHPPQRQDDGDLLEPQAQAAARLNAHRAESEAFNALGAGR